MDNDLIFNVYNSQCDTNIQLKMSTLVNHIVDEHDERSFMLNEDNLKRIALGLQDPAIVIKDSKHDNRKNYYSLVPLVSDQMNSDSIECKIVKTVTEPIDDQCEDVVTIFPTRKMNSINEDDVIYMKSEWLDDGI